MNENINNLIPLAIEAIRNSGMETTDKKTEKKYVPSEFKGYISSMGASILQTGLLATIAFYANDDGKKGDSKHLLNAILRLINPNYSDNDKSKLITFIINKSSPQGNNVGINNLDFDKLYIMEEKVTEALIALKLALRTFKLSE